jgi:hypothetical protein
MYGRRNILKRTYSPLSHSNLSQSLVDGYTASFGIGGALRTTILPMSRPIQNGKNVKDRPI